MSSYERWINNSEGSVIYPLLKKMEYLLTLPLLRIRGALACGKHWRVVLLAEVYTKLGIRKFSDEVLCISHSQGGFYVRNSSMDLITVSLAYEKADIDRLSRMIKTSLSDQNNVVFFIDVGASFGKYSITLGNMFKKYHSRFKIYAFEPEEDSYCLLKKNVWKNRIRNIKLFNQALSATKGKATLFLNKEYGYLVTFNSKPSYKVNLHVDKLDNFISSQVRGVSVYIKLDVEGWEVAVLEGAKETIRRAKEVVLLVEDSSTTKGQSLVKYLSKNFIFLSKSGPMNSLWRSTPK